MRVLQKSRDWVVTSRVDALIVACEPVWLAHLWLKLDLLLRDVSEYITIVNHLTSSNLRS